MKKIRPGYILPSAAFTIKSSQIKHFLKLDQPPKAGDIVYGRVVIDWVLERSVPTASAIGSSLLWRRKRGPRRGVRRW